MIVLDIDMPKSCSECPLLSEEVWCVVTGTSVWQNHIDHNKERLPDCPIHGEREIIKPHQHHLCIKEMSNICGQCVMYFSCPYL